MPNQTDRKEGVWESLRRAVEGLAALLQRYAREGNRRQVAFKDKHDKTLFQAPLTLVVLVGLLLVLMNAAPLLVIAVLVALVLGYQFVLSKTEG